MTARESLAAVALSLVLFAPVARAFDLPFQEPIACGDPDISGNMESPSSFASSPKCESLCKNAVSDCKKLVKRIADCYVAYWKTTAAYGNRNCREPDYPGDSETCRRNNAQRLHDIKDGIELETSLELSQCESWGDACRPSCKK